jgi:ACS family hexuronate transporter-like MFS transporter
MGLPLFLPEIGRSLSIGIAETQLIFGLVPLASIVANFAGGVAGDWYSARWTVGLAGIVVGASALSRAVVPGYWGELAASLVLGLGVGTVTPCFLSALARWFPSRELGLANGIRSVGGTAGAAAGHAFVVHRVLQATGDWRMAQVVLGFVAIGVSLVWILAYTEPPEVSVTRAKRSDATASESAASRSLTALFRIPDVVLLGMIVLVAFFGMQAFIGLLPTWLEQLTFLERGQEGVYSSLLFVASIPGAVALPLLSDRLARRKLAVVAGIAVAK